MPTVSILVSWETVRLRTTEMYHLTVMESEIKVSVWLVASGGLWGRTSSMTLLVSGVSLPKLSSACAALLWFLSLSSHSVLNMSVFKCVCVQMSHLLFFFFFILTQGHFFIVFFFSCCCRFVFLREKKGGRKTEKCLCKREASIGCLPIDCLHTHQD